MSTFETVLILFGVGVALMSPLCIAWVAYQADSISDIKLHIVIKIIMVIAFILGVLMCCSYGVLVFENAPTPREIIRSLR